MKLLLFILFISYSLSLHCQHFGARNIALGHTISTQSDVISATSNIAKLASITRFSAGISSSNNFLLKELQESLICFSLPFRKSAVAFSISNFGFQLYRENSFSIGYAIQLSPKLSIGLKVISNFVSIKENTNKQFSIYPNVGLNYQIDEKVQLGLVLTNLTLSQVYAKSPSRWPIGALIGMNYKLNKKFDLFLDYKMNLEQQASIAFGAEYQMIKKLTLRIGLNSFPQSISFGFGCNVKSFSIDLAASYDPHFGFSPSLSFRFEAFH